MTIDEKSASLALRAKCGLCKAEPGQPCINPCTGKPRTDRPCCFYRIEPK